MTKAADVGPELILLSTVHVRVGSVVRIRDQDGEVEFSIVDPGDADAYSGRISSQSPLAQALLGCVAGQRVRFGAPAGTRIVELLAVR